MLNPNFKNTAPARSNTGCWTCRIRKKKCDDVKPACGPCTLRFLTCHGYGAKPSWMDSGANQKAEIERIKRAVNRSFKSRLASRISRKSALRPSTLDPPKAVKESNVETKALPADLLNENISELEILRLKDPPHPEMITLPRVKSWSKLPNTSEQLFIPRSQHLSSNSHVSGVEDLDQGGTSAYSYLSDVLPAANQDEFSMIMHYLDNIFPLRFYFYQPLSPQRGRGWLLNLLLRAKASYYTALAFSVLHQIIFNYNGDITMEQRLFPKLDEYHSVAIEHLQRQLDYLPTTSGPEHLKTGVEILACSMELMSIEVFRETKEFEGPRGDWEVHLQAAGALLAVIGTELRSNSIRSSLDDDDPLLPASETENPKTLLPLNDIAGLDFFITCYIWSDISRCASIGVGSSNQVFFPYLTYLEEERVRLDHMMGCRNWVMLIVKQISDLAAWRIEMQNRDCLSLPIVSTKSLALERRLNLGLKSVFDGFDDLTQYERECSLVTHIWGLSALTYLAVVVSGNSHLHPEVRLSVPRTLKALKSLPQHLLIRVSWAFCVAGCMAYAEEMDEFKQLLYTAQKNGHILGTLWNALEIMEEFWTLREGPGCEMDKTPWAASMDSLGLKILLI
jgi:hypothetical protein